MLTILTCLAVAIGTRETIRYAGRRRRVRRAAPKSALRADADPKPKYRTPTAEPVRDLFWD